jgi:alkylation response protein AidB-like acyl-CoA dehydrogenase
MTEAREVLQKGGRSMDFFMSPEILEQVQRFRIFLGKNLNPHLSQWNEKGEVPRSFFSLTAEQGWFSFSIKEERLVKHSSLREALLAEEMAKISPGVAVAVLAHQDLGLTGLWLFGSDLLHKKYGPSAVQGNILLCVGNTESGAGSDSANIAMGAAKVEGGWVLNGAKAYVTNGLISDYAVLTALSDPEAERNRRSSMFLVDLSSKGVSRFKLNKKVWIPSDLTRIQCSNVFVPEDHLLGERGRGLQQVLSIFTHSRVIISALTLGTALGAFDLALAHGKKRKIFGLPVLDHQAKALESADFYARLEAARLMMLKACWAMDQRIDFRLESSLAKYLAVQVARDVTLWAADLFGASSVIFEHPVHKFPLDAWASSLGEGTQDVQKLIIFREMMKS